MPDNARYGYVYAVALDGLGDRPEAMRVLENTLERQPYDRDSLGAMVVFQRRAGNDREALAYQARLAALEHPGAAASN